MLGTRGSTAHRRRPGARTRALGLAALCLALGAALAGCGGKRNGLDKKPKEEKPTIVTARGFTGRWMEKTTGGHVRKVMEVHSAQGALDSQTNSGTLYDVDGTIYRDGAAKAKFTAPKVIADRDTEALQASGGVTMHSLDPPGAVIRCNTMNWHAQNHTVVAEGAVQIDYTPRQAQTPSISGGPFDHVTIDTGLQNLTIP